MYPLQLEIYSLISLKIQDLIQSTFSGYGQFRHEKNMFFFSILPYITPYKVEKNVKVYLINLVHLFVRLRKLKMYPPQQKVEWQPISKIYSTMGSLKIQSGKNVTKIHKKWLIWNIPKTGIQLWNSCAYFARGKHDMRRLNFSFFDSEPVFLRPS